MTDNGMLSYQSQRRLPAWAMSAVFHVAVIVLVALLWQNARPAGQGITESARSGAIVVAVSANGETEYFTESDAASASEAASDAAPSGAPADALPTSDAVADLPEQPNIALPGAVQGSVSAQMFQGTESVEGSGVGLPDAGDTEQALAAIRRQEAAMKGPPPIGTPAKLNIFGSGSVGRSFVFVIDRSRSMGASGLGVLSAAQTELRRALGELTPSQRFEIIVYNQTPDSFGYHYNKRRGLVKVTEERVKQVDQFMESVFAGGTTEHYYGLMGALDLRPEVVYLLTDGDDALNPSQLNRLAARAKNQGTTIHAIKFGFGPLQEDSNFMMTLSQRTGGSFTYFRMDGNGKQ